MTHTTHTHMHELHNVASSSAVFPAASHDDVVSLLRCICRYGPPGCGKCFAAGTMLRLHNGDTIAVESIVGGELLMGDDGNPRVVTAGSLSRGRAVLYRIQPEWDGAAPFAVNGDHILVLIINCRPCMEWLESVKAWRVLWYQVDTSNAMRQITKMFAAQSEAEAEFCDQSRLWTPLEWEVSVDDFLMTSAHIREKCQLMQSGPVTFRSSHFPNLHHTLSLVLGSQASVAQVEWAAWYVGMWLSVGCSEDDCISQSGPPHADIMGRLLDYQRLFGETVQSVLNQASAAGHPARFFQFGTSGVPSIVRRLLSAYGLVGNKHIPQAWICDTLDVRRRILAGIIDGDGHYHADNNSYSINANQHSVTTGYKLLAASLGIRNSNISNTRCFNSETGEEYDGYSVLFSGHMSDVVQHCAVAGYKQCPQPGSAVYLDKKAVQDTSCYGFTITQQPVDHYYGFAVHGGINRRFLLEDFTVTHNVPHSHTRPHSCIPGSAHSCYNRTQPNLTSCSLCVLCCAATEQLHSGVGRCDAVQYLRAEPEREISD
jgi:Hom_end-associated Hint/Homing endonuclease